MFRSKESSKETPLEPATPPKSPDGRHAQSLTQVSPGARFKGDLKTEGSVSVDGRVEGSLTAGGDVQIGTEGVVEAEIEARNITVAGKVKGRIYADGKAVLLAGSRVEGDIHAQSLKIEDSVYFQGGCVMGQEARKMRARQTDATLPSTVKKVESLKAA